MSQTDQERQATAPAAPAARKHWWEYFWRVIAVLMVIVIAWVIWVLYQITPRSVVTPLAYESKGKPAAITQQPATAAAAGTAGASSAVQPATPAVPDAPRAAALAAAAQAMERAQAGLRDGAHQASADVQARAVQSENDRAAEATRPAMVEGLRLSTEITHRVEDKKKPAAQ